MRKLVACATVMPARRRCVRGYSRGVAQPELPEKPTVRRYPRRTAAALGWLALLFFFAPLVLEIALKRLGIPTSGLSTPAMLTSLLIAPLTALVGGYLRVIGLGGRAELVAEDNHLVIKRDEGQERLLRSAVVGGFVEPARNGATVEIELRGESVLRTSVSTLEDGEALLQELGVDAARRRCRVSLASEGRRVLAGVLATFGWFMTTVWTMMIVDDFVALPRPLPFGALLLWMASWVAVPWLAMRLSRPTAVVIGAEGIRIERGVRSTSIAYDDIADINQTSNGIEIALASRKVVTVGNGWTEVDHNGPAIVHRVRKVLDARRRGSLPATKLALLARDRRPLAAWRESLRALTEAGGGYRGVTVTTEDLAGVLESEAATAEQKLAAALALASASREEAEEKVRIAADRATSDKVRIALESIASGDGEDEALEEALAELEPKERHARAPG